MLWSGLYAANRPFMAATSQLVGLVVTVFGLLLFLRQGGILAAALVSTASYSVVFLVALLLYRRAAKLEWSGLLPSPAQFLGAGQVALRSGQYGVVWRRLAGPWRR
jgi:hypothetical protein